MSSRVGITLAVMALSTAATAQEIETPEEVVHAAAEAALIAIEERREELQADPSKLREIVEEVFLPRFDRAYAAFLVLGRHGREATPEQRTQFTDALYEYILTRYSGSLIRFEAERLEILPWTGDPDEDRATVRSSVVLDSGARALVNYDLRKGNEGWKVYDVTIDGISYVRNLRSQLGAEIEKTGLDDVIRRLEANEILSGGTP